MKKIKTLSILMALIMLLSVSVSVFAENDADEGAISEASEAVTTEEAKNDDEETTDEEETSKIFSDVNKSQHSWAITYIEDMAEKGIINGYSDGTFKPDNVVTKLEALSLTARILGVNDEANEDLLNTAIEAYYDVVSTFELNFGTNEVCYLLIKNVITVEELNKYLDEANISEGMKRYEVAELLTKALDADDEVSKNLITNLEFDDKNDIPAYAKRYVEYVTTKGLMNGVGDNKFSPMTDVTRAQIAVLMNKLLIMTNYEFTSGVVAEMDNASRIIKIKTEDGSILKYTVNANVYLRFEGAEITINDVASGYDAVVTLQEGTLYAIDFTTPLIDKEITGVITSVSSGSKPSLSLYVVNDDDVEISQSTKETYPISSNVITTYNDESSGLQAIKSNTFVKIVVEKGEVTLIKAYDKTNTVSGRITNIEVTPVCKITVELTSGEEVTYVVGNNVEVSRNGSKATAADVVSGDSVYLTTTYERITKIVATSKQQKKAGIIQEVIISANPKITVKTADGTSTFNITNSCVLDLPGKESASFYDLRVGVSVELTLEGDTVVKLSANIAEGVTQISGVVSSVNTSYSVIQVSYVDPETGITVIEPVFVKTKATIIDILSGNSVKLSNIKTGAKITAFGLRNNGVFEATTINVTNN